MPGMMRHLPPRPGPGSGPLCESASKEAASETPGRPPVGFAPWCLPRGNINHRVSYWFYVHICLLRSALFSYRNNPGIDRIILMHFNLTRPIDNVFVKITLNNHK